MAKLLRIALMAACMIGSATANAGFEVDEYDYQLKLGGFSKHFKASKNGVDYKLNETHEGFGISAYKDIDKAEWLKGTWFAENFDLVSYDAYWMRESFYQDSYQVGMTLYKTWDVNVPAVHKIDFAMVTGIMSRSIGTMNDETGDILKTERAVFPFVLPGVSWHISEDVHIDMTYVPYMGELNELPVFYARLGLEF